MTSGRVIVITGAMAAGKSTIAELLAQRLPHSVHVRGDVFRRMIVNGGVEMSRDPSEEAVRQLRLRYRLAAHTADTFAAAGFDVVVQDVIIGMELPGFLALLETEQRYLVVLAPSESTLVQREEARIKTGYVGYSPAQLNEVLREQTPDIGYWLDSSDQNPAETVADVLAHLEDARL